MREEATGEPMVKSHDKIILDLIERDASESFSSEHQETKEGRKLEMAQAK